MQVYTVFSKYRDQAKSQHTVKMGKHPKESFMLFSGINIYQPVQENVTFLCKQRICSESIPEETEEMEKEERKNKRSKKNTTCCLYDVKLGYSTESQLRSWTNHCYFFCKGEWSLFQNTSHLHYLPATDWSTTKMAKDHYTTWKLKIIYKLMHVLNENKQAVSMHHTHLIKALHTFSSFHLLSSQRNTISLLSFLMSIIDNHVK